MHIYVFIHICIHTYVYTYVYTYIHIFIHTHKHKHTHIHTHMYFSLAAITCPAAVVYAEDGMWRKAQLFRLPFFKPHLFTVPWALSVSLSPSTSLLPLSLPLYRSLSPPPRPSSHFLSPPRTGEAFFFWRLIQTGQTARGGQLPRQLPRGGFGQKRTFGKSIPWTIWELSTLLPFGRLRRRTFKCFSTC
jgi:hypothetical protein